MSNLREAKQAGQSKLISHLRQGHIKNLVFAQVILININQSNAAKMHAFRSQAATLSVPP